jgi:hypothetical protein
MDYYANVDQAVEEAVLGKRPAQPPANPTQGGQV